VREVIWKDNHVLETYRGRYNPRSHDWIQYEAPPSRMHQHLTATTHNKVQKSCTHFTNDLAF
jgi:hypothetical protein